jgi:hypothetical protein
VTLRAIFEDNVLKKEFQFLEKAWFPKHRFVSPFFSMMTRLKDQQRSKKIKFQA